MLRLFELTKKKYCHINKTVAFKMIQILLFGVQDTRKSKTNPSDFKYVSSICFT